MEQEAWEAGIRILPITDTLQNFGMIIELILYVTQADTSTEIEPIHTCKH